MEATGHQFVIEPFPQGVPNSEIGLAKFHDVCDLSIGQQIVDG